MPLSWLSPCFRPDSSIAYHYFMNLDVMSSPKRQVGFQVLGIANLYLPSPGLSWNIQLNAAPSLRCLMADYATPACIFGDYPTNANVCELSTSVTSQQGIFVDARAPNPGTVFDHCFVECELWLVRASIAMCAGCLAPTASRCCPPLRYAAVSHLRACVSSARVGTSQAK